MTFFTFISYTYFIHVTGLPGPCHRTGSQASIPHDPLSTAPVTKKRSRGLSEEVRLHAMDAIDYVKREKNCHSGSFNAKK